MSQRRYRSHHRRAPAHPPQNQSQQTVVVIGAVVVVAVVIVLVLMSSGSSEPEVPAAPPKAEQPKKPPPKDPRLDERNKARWWFDETFYNEYGKQRTLTGRQIHDLMDEAKQKGYPKLLGKDWDARTRKLYERLIEREPNDPDANRAMGRIPLSDYPDFYKVFRRMADAKALPKEFEELRDEYEGKVQYGPRWRTPAVPKEEFQRISGVLSRFEAFDKRMNENPAERAIFEALARVKLHPILGAYETVHIERPPWVLFYAHKDLTPRNDTDAEKQRIARKREQLEKRLDSYTQLLNDYLAFFKQEWMQPLGLPDFEDQQLFFVWMFDDRKRFDEFGRSIGQVYPPGLLGYFNHRDHWVYLYEPAKDRFKVETSLAHELTHQMHWHFSADSGQFDNHFVRSKATWFKEGWAEYIGWCKKEAGRYVFLQNAHSRMDVFHLCRKAKLPVYPVQELLKAENYVHYLRSIQTWLRAHLKKKNLELAGGFKNLMDMIYLEMLYAEGWLFIKFLYEYKGGKYKQKALDFTKANLKGYLGFTGERGYAQAHEVFSKIFFGKTKATKSEWAALQKEFDEFVEAKMYEIPPTR